MVSKFFFFNLTEITWYRIMRASNITISYAQGLKGYAQTSIRFRGYSFEGRVKECYKNVIGTQRFFALLTLMALYPSIFRIHLQRLTRYGMLIFYENTRYLTTNLLICCLFIEIDHISEWIWIFFYKCTFVMRKLNNSNLNLILKLNSAI